MGAVELAGRRVLITGGLGFIGSNLAARCVELGAAVTLVSRSLTRSANAAAIRSRVRIEPLDLAARDGARAKLAALLDGQDAIFHLAASTSHIDSMRDPLADLDANCATTLNLLEAARVAAPGAAIVMTGTVTQAGLVAALPAGEDAPDWPLSIYDAHKLTCEKYLYLYGRSYGLRTTTLRLANVFGERQSLDNPRRGILNYMLGRALRGEPLAIYEPGDFVRDYSHVQNAVDALLACACSPRAAGRSYVFGSGVGLRFDHAVARLLRELREQTGIEARVERVPWPAGEKRIDAGDFVADASRLRAETGWSPRLSFEQGLERMVRFYAEARSGSARAEPLSA